MKSWKKKQKPLKKTQKPQRSTKLISQASTIPQRICVSCRKRFERTALLRVIHDRQQSLVVLQEPLETLSTRYQGRSSYVCATEACLRVALKGKKLQKSLKTPLADDIVTVLEGLVQVP